MNANYFFELHKYLLFYTVVGLDYSREDEEVTLFDERETIEDDAIGYNLGVGFEIPLLHRFAFLAEYTHIFSDLKNNIVFVGFVYEWGKPKNKHEKE